jgi:hypothetical protein
MFMTKDALVSAQATTEAFIAKLYGRFFYDRKARIRTSLIVFTSLCILVIGISLGSAPSPSPPPPTLKQGRRWAPVLPISAMNTDIQRWLNEENKLRALVNGNRDRKCFCNRDIGMLYPVIAFNDVVVWNPRMVSDNAPGNWFEAMTALSPMPQRFPVNISIEGVILTSGETIRDIVLWASSQPTKYYSFTPSPIIVDSDPILVACVFKTIEIASFI